MLGNFSYCNPTKLYFGDKSLDFLADELKNYGDNILFVYGGGSIKKNGIYDSIMEILEKSGKNVFFDGGVMPNPTKEKLYEGIDIARKNKIDFILAVGGGSVIDYAKALSVSIYSTEDPWKKYFIEFKDVDNKIVPVGSILTMVGTGSEMNGGAVITSPSEKLKMGHVFGTNVFPKFSILNPTFTYSVPMYQMVAGIYDAFNHITEQYFSGDDTSTSDFLMEGLLRELIRDSRIAVKDPTNYEARSNIMWSATWALNTLVGKGKSQDWMIHMIGQAIGGVTNATHGMTLSAITDAYYRYIMPYGLPQFVKFAKNVWNIDPSGKTDLEIATLGLDRLRDWMGELGLVTNVSDLGLKEDMIDDVLAGTLISDGGYKVLDKEEIRQIILKSM